MRTAEIRIKLEHKHTIGSRVLVGGRQNCGTQFYGHYCVVLVHNFKGCTKTTTGIDVRPAISNI